MGCGQAATATRDANEHTATYARKRLFAGSRKCLGSRPRSASCELVQICYQTELATGWDRFPNAQAR